MACAWLCGGFRWLAGAGRARARLGEADGKIRDRNIAPIFLSAFPIPRRLAFEEQVFALDARYSVRQHAAHHERAGTVESQKHERVAMNMKRKQTNRVTGLAVLLLTGLGLASLADAQPGEESSRQLKGPTSPATARATATAEEAPPPPADLGQAILGTWELVATKTASATKFTDFPKDHRRVQLFTPYRYLWADYDTATKTTAAEAGGPYALNDDVCTATIEFANEEMAPHQGSNSNFKLRIEGDRCYQSGGLGDAGTEEVWRRIAETPAEGQDNVRKDLVGAWELVAFREWNTTNYIKAPVDRRRVKFFTLSYSAWVDYDLAGKSITMGAGGPYTVPDTFYVETIQFADGFMTRFLGAHPRFKLRVEGDIYYQLALSKINYDEIWQRIKSPEPPP